MAMVDGSEEQWSTSRALASNSRWPQLWYTKMAHTRNAKFSNSPSVKKIIKQWNVLHLVGNVSSFHCGIEISLFQGVDKLRRSISEFIFNSYKSLSSDLKPASRVRRNSKHHFKNIRINHKHDKQWSSLEWTRSTLFFNPSAVGLDDLVGTEGGPLPYKRCGRHLWGNCPHVVKTFCRVI